MSSPPSSPASGSTSSYPETIAPLAGLQFIALAWVILNQFRFHLGLPVDQDSGLAHDGYLGAELFFIATGFVTAHLYGRESAARDFRFGGFLWTRLIRVYPLHVATIAGLGLLVIGAGLRHAHSQHGIFTPHGLISNLLMVQAWGIEPTVSWNFPSWLISAEWFAYIVFPVTAWLATKLWRGVVAAVAGPVVWFAVLFIAARLRGTLFTDMTAQIGALQTIPAFLFGIGLHRLGRESELPAGAGALVAALAGLFIVIAAMLRLPDPVFFPIFGALVFGLAETAKEGHPALSGPMLRYLARISYAVYLVYLPVDIVYFHAVTHVFGQPAGALAWALWAGVFPVILATGAAAYHLIQTPAERWLRAHEPFGARASAAPTQI
jgi:peptidoglycan/LPS O-acetylase OafA/YrhL